LCRFAFQRIVILCVISLLERRHRLVGYWLIETVATLTVGLRSLADPSGASPRPSSTHKELTGVDIFRVLVLLLCKGVSRWRIESNEWKLYDAVLV
jgi:hypothetical protein